MHSYNPYIPSLAPFFYISLQLTKAASRYYLYIYVGVLVGRIV